MVKILRTKALCKALQNFSAAFKKFATVSAVASLALAAIHPSAAFAQTTAVRSDAPPPARPVFPSVTITNTVNGEAAIQSLGTKLPGVATHYGKSPQELRDQFRQDKSAWLDRGGRMFFVEKALASSGSDLAPSGAIYPLDQTFLLHSRPSSKRKIYLDFNGHTTTGTAWNSSYGITSIVSPPFDLDGIPGTFNTNELGVIQNIWRRVAEDYAAFDVDVTTAEPAVDQMTRISLSDTTFGVRAVITKDFTASTPSSACNCGGFAYLGVFDMTSEFYKPAFIFYDRLGSSEKAIAEAISHEVGHNVGLSHDGTSNTGYYQGHGTGATGWAPIMGVGYYKELVQFSKGEYAGANNKEDDYLVMQSYGVTFAADDYGNTPASAFALIPTSQGGMNSFAVQGVIETPSDVDVFKFVSGAGTVTVTANPFDRSPNLDILLQLINANGVVVAESNPADLLSGSISFVVPLTGNYYVSVRGTGKADPLVAGYSVYGSLGRYTVNVTAPMDVASAPVSLITSNVTAGAAPLAVVFSGASSTPNSGSITNYEWNFGDGSPLATGVSVSHTYAAAGTYAATLKVTNSGGLTDISAVTITVTAPVQQPKVFVESIVMNLVRPWSTGKPYVRAAITVKDNAGKLVSNAVVYGTWSGIVNGNVSGITNSTGVAVANSPSTLSTGSVNFAVTGITISGYAYDASLNKMTSNSINK